MVSMSHNCRARSPSYKKGTKLKETDRNLTYDKGKNPAAGPKWDKALMAAEGDAMTADVQDYVDRKAGKQ